MKRLVLFLAVAVLIQIGLLLFILMQSINRGIQVHQQLYKAVRRTFTNNLPWDKKAITCLPCFDYSTSETAFRCNRR